MDKPLFPIIHRLPYYYYWSSAAPEVLDICHRAEIASRKNVIIFELPDQYGQDSLQVMRMLQQMLADIDIDSKVLEWQEGSRLLVASTDEATVNCCLKNNGVAITENFIRR